MSNEQWRPVPGYEGSYEVSDLGRIKSLPKRRRGERILQGSTCTDGYLQVGLCCGGMTRRLVHSIVAEVFIGPRPEGLQINHIDGDKKNNDRRNLEYVTPRENIRHSFDTGLHVAPHGEAHCRAKLRPWHVRGIRYAVANGVDRRRLREAFGITAGGIDSVVSRRSWRHVE
jgi:hypothetical protein